MATFGEELGFTLPDWVGKRSFYVPKNRAAYERAGRTIAKALGVPKNPGRVNCVSLDVVSMEELDKQASGLNVLKNRENLGSIPEIPNSRLMYGEDILEKGFEYNIDKYVIFLINNEVASIFWVDGEGI